MATRRRIQDYIRQHPGSTRSQIGRATGIPTVIVHFGLRRLKKEVRVAAMQDGSNVRYFPDGPVERPDDDPAIS